MAAGTAYRLRQCLDHREVGGLDALNDQLRDPVTAVQGHRIVQIVIDQLHENLAAIASIHRAGGVDDPQAVLGAEAGSRMHKAGVPVWEGNRDAGADQQAFAGTDRHIRGGHEVSPGVAWIRVRGRRDFGVEEADRDGDRGIHGANITGHAMAVRGPVGSPATGPCEHHRVTPAPRYEERLSVPRWWHLGSPVFGLLIGGEMVLTDHPVVAASIVLGMTLLAEIVISGLGRARIVVADGRIRAGNWRLPVAAVRGVAQLTPEQMHAESRRRDDSIYRCTASWVGPGLMLEVDDPDDLPLWLISTRHPAALRAALAAEAL